MVTLERSAPSDGDLLARVARGDEESFAELFHRHYDRVYGVLFRLVGERAEAEDLAQEVFLRLQRHAGRRRGDDNVAAWLYRVATNLGYNALRDRKRRRQRDTLLLDEPSGADSVEANVTRRQERAAVRAALARLNERDARLLVLRQMEFSYAECAAVCGVAPGSVGTLLARAAQAFRAAYEEVTAARGSK